MGEKGPSKCQTRGGTEMNGDDSKSGKDQKAGVSALSNGEPEVRDSPS